MALLKKTPIFSHSLNSLTRYIVFFPRHQNNYVDRRLIRFDPLPTFIIIRAFLLFEYFDEPSIKALIYLPIRVFPSATSVIPRCVARSHGIVSRTISVHEAR